MAFLGKLIANLSQHISSPQNSPATYFRPPPTLILPLFSISAAVIGFLIWTDHPLKADLGNAWIFGIGVGGLTLALVLYWLPWPHFSWIYDFFCTASLLLWVSSWQEVYRPDAPIFRLYPLYFVILTLLVTYTLVRNRELNQVENENTKLLRLMLRSPFLHPLIFFSLILWSVARPDYYLAYPVLMSLLLIRYALSECFYNQPILYFQANRELSPSSLFSHFIYPLVRRYGPTLVLVPRPPLSSTALPPIRDKNTKLAWITEEQWKQWLHALTCCFVIFLDFRQTTQEVASEQLQSVCARMPHHRIVVLCDDASKLLIPADVLYFSATHLENKQRLQTNLEQWLKQISLPFLK